MIYNSRQTTNIVINENFDISIDFSESKPHIVKCELCNRNVVCNGTFECCSCDRIICKNCQIPSRIIYSCDNPNCNYCPRGECENIVVGQEQYCDDCIGLIRTHYRNQNNNNDNDNNSDNDSDRSEYERDFDTDNDSNDDNKRALEDEIIWIDDLLKKKKYKPIKDKYKIEIKYGKIKNSYNDECNICVSDENILCQMSCDHIICFKCYILLLYNDMHECPLCRSAITNVVKINKNYKK
ncbi:hypothetical protein BMW23_0114 [Bodo saltans virus]|uniref:RING-type domain-containing protein n=1 Tax=Bodo saltans virus TaxID=2024608 RepID=A0A2H4UTH2_9VIRU|nr:hypothetical protein QJ851_gp0111 [Bodo saltans virus]ATZ80174.1 hypothetical protein BMW23_0114 [Bodo saltans virus]